MRLTALIILIAFTSCRSSSEGRTDAISSSAPVYSGAVSTSTDQSAMAVSKKSNAVQSGVGQSLLSESQFRTYDHKIIKTTRLTLEVEDYRNSLAEFRALVELHGAYVAREEHNYNRRTSQGNTIEIRVPNEEFTDLLTGLEAVGLRIISKELKAQDVTQEFVDIAARIKSKKAVAQRYEEILKKSGTIEELLHIEEKLRHVREEIEAKEGRLRYLTNRVSYGTIVLTIIEKSEPVLVVKDKFKFDDDLKAAFLFGWSGIKQLLLVIVHLWPFWFILIPLLFFFRRRLLSLRGA